MNRAIDIMHRVMTQLYAEKPAGTIMLVPPSGLPEGWCRLWNRPSKRPFNPVDLITVDPDRMIKIDE